VDGNPLGEREAEVEAPAHSEKVVMTGGQGSKSYISHNV